MYIIIIYISAIITTLSVVGIFIYHRENKELNKTISGLNQALANALNKVGEVTKSSSKRMAKIRWGNWHKKNDTSKKWAVNLELREVALSSDEKKIKFEVVSFTSENIDENWNIDDYSKYFYRVTGGGWLEVKSDNSVEGWKTMEFDWITTQSKADIRGEKIDELLKK